MQGDADGLKVFTGRANPQLAQKICDYLQIPLGRGRTELFPDGELIVKVEEDVRGRDCFVGLSVFGAVDSRCTYDLGTAGLLRLFHQFVQPDTDCAIRWWSCSGSH